MMINYNRNLVRTKSIYLNIYFNYTMTGYHISYPKKFYIQNYFYSRLKIDFKRRSKLIPKDIYFGSSISRWHYWQNTIFTNHLKMKFRNNTMG